MEGAMKYFPGKLLGHEIFRSMVSQATNFFWKICKTLQTPSYILNVRSFNSISIVSNTVTWIHIKIFHKLLPFVSRTIVKKNPWGIDSKLHYSIIHCYFIFVHEGIKSLSSLKSIKTCLMTSLIILVNPGLFLYKSVFLILSAWNLH